MDLDSVSNYDEIKNAIMEKVLMLPLLVLILEE